MPWERFEVKLESVNSLVRAEVEERGIWVNNPLVRRNHSRAVIVCPVVSDKVHIAEFAHLVVVLVRPHSGDHKIGNSLGLQSNQILDDSSVLHGGTALLYENAVVFWDLKEFPDLILGHG